MKPEYNDDYQRELVKTMQTTPQGGPEYNAALTFFYKNYRNKYARVLKQIVGEERWRKALRDFDDMYDHAFLFVLRARTFHTFDLSRGSRVADYLGEAFRYAYYEYMNDCVMPKTQRRAIGIAKRSQCTITSMLPPVSLDADLYDTIAFQSESDTEENAQYREHLRETVLAASALMDDESREMVESIIEGTRESVHDNAINSLAKRIRCSLNPDAGARIRHMKRGMISLLINLGKYFEGSEPPTQDEITPAMENLGKRDRVELGEYYFDNASVRKMAKTHGVTPQRICQRVRNAEARLARVILDTRKGVIKTIDNPEKIV